MSAGRHLITFGFGDAPASHWPFVFGKARVERNSGYRDPKRAFVAAELVETARRPTERLYAQQASFACKGALRGADYRWTPERRAWWIEGYFQRIANERCWLVGLSGAICPAIVQIDWMTRFA